MPEDPISDRLAEFADRGLDTLSDVARRSLGLAAFELSGWSVSPLRHEKVIETTGGLFRLYGVGETPAEPRPWSVVLKVVNPSQEDCLAPQALGYWRRELLAYSSGLLADLPAPVRAPRCYGVDERPHEAWIWLEDIRETVEPTWSLAHFHEAARQPGQFAGAYLCGRPLPDLHWLCGSFFRSLYADRSWWAGFIDPASPDNAWQRPAVQSVYAQPLSTRVLEIWQQKQHWLSANERLPQVLCHNDAHRRNMMLCTLGNGGEELVLIDWAFCGRGGLGNDFGELVGTSLSYFAVEPARASELEAAVLEGYLAGLRFAGWAGDGRLARLGYLISLALYWGGTLPCEVAIAQPGMGRVNAEAKFGQPVESLLPGWTSLAEFSLDRAEEAQYWMKRIAI